MSGTGTVKTDGSKICSGLLTSLSLGGFLVLALGVPGANGEPSDLPPAVEQQIEFSRDIKPMLEARCVVCHGPSQQINGLRLDRKVEALKGGYSGPVILPGNSEQSKLIHLVSGIGEKVFMPPVGPKLSRKEVGLLRAWIDQGALWSEEGKPTETPGNTL